MIEQTATVRRQAQRLRGQLENLSIQRERGLDSFARHLQRLEKVYSIHHANRAIEQLDREGFFAEENGHPGLYVTALGLNHLLFEQVIRKGIQENDKRIGFTKKEKAAIRRVYRAYAMQALFRPKTLEGPSLAESKTREKEMHEAMKHLSGLENAPKILQIAIGHFNIVREAMAKKLKERKSGSMATKIMGEAAGHFTGLLDALTAYIEEPRLRAI